MGWAEIRGGVWTRPRGKERAGLKCGAGRGRSLGRAEARGAGRGLRRVSRAASRAPPKPEPTRVHPSPRPPPGAMEPELGGEAAALLRQKRAALRRRGCSFESPRYCGWEGCGREGRKLGAGHV